MSSLLSGEFPPPILTFFPSNKNNHDENVYGWLAKHLTAYQVLYYVLCMYEAFIAYNNPTGRCYLCPHLKMRKKNESFAQDHKPNEW